MPRQNAEVIARWEGRVSTTTCTPREFLTRVEDAVLERGLEDLNMSTIARPERGFFSARRLYLRVRHDRLFFDISAFPDGDGLTVGYWLHRDSPGLVELFAEIPVVGWLIELIAGGSTYYRVDKIASFQRRIHETVVQVAAHLSAAEDVDEIPETAPAAVREDVW